MKRRDRSCRNEEDADGPRRDGGLPSGTRAGGLRRSSRATTSDRLPTVASKGSRARRMKVRDVIRVLTDSGFRQIRQSGSHRQFEGFVNGRRRLVTVAGKESVHVKAGTLASIRQQSGLPRKLFR